MTATITRLAGPLGHGTFGIADWYTNPIAIDATQVTFGALSPDVEQALNAGEEATRSILDAVAFASPGTQRFMAHRRSDLHAQVTRWMIASSAESAAGIEVRSNAAASTAIRALERRLGLPLRSVLKAAGVKPRTFYSWEERPAVTPRVSSQGRLWSLCQCIEDLEEIFDGRLDRLQEPSHIGLLEQGLFDELIDAVFAATRRRGLTPPLLYTGDDTAIVEMPTSSGDIPVQPATLINW